MRALVGDAKYILSSLIQSVGMNIQFSAMRVCEDEATLPAAGTRPMHKSAQGQELTEARYMPMWDGDIQITVRLRLFNQKRVHCPAPINVDLDAMLLWISHHLCDVSRFHGRTLAN